MKNALLRGFVVFGLGFGLLSLSACADQADVEPPVTEEPMDVDPSVVEEEPMMDDSLMTDSTMLEEPMEEVDADYEPAE